MNHQSTATFFFFFFFLSFSYLMVGCAFSLISTVDDSALKKLMEVRVTKFFCENQNGRYEIGKEREEGLTYDVWPLSPGSD